MSVTYDDIVNAQKTQDDVIRKTPLVFSDTFSQLTGSKVYLKNEFEQKTGSFKLRGAYYKIKNLTEDEKNKGVVAASAGNHAQGIALASAMEKIKGYYRDIGKLGMTDMGKIKAIVVKSGDKLIVGFDDGDGILYEIIEDLVNPLRMIKTLSENEIKEYS